MTSFKKAAIIGASGGIGRAMTHQLAAECEQVFALSRSEAMFDLDNVKTLAIDLAKESTITYCAEALKAEGPIDLIVVATGFLHAGDIQPEKSIRSLSAEGFETNFAVNTIGPALVAKHFLSLLPRGERGIFAALSARVGSISDNRIGGWYSYRASKAALNMVLKGLSIEHGRKHKSHIILGLHPGTVDTDLSEPFQGNVPDGKLFTPAYSAQKLLGVIAEATPDMSGRVVDWAGEIVPT